MNHRQNPILLTRYKLMHLQEGYLMAANHNVQSTLLKILSQRQNHRSIKVKMEENIMCFTKMIQSQPMDKIVGSKVSMLGSNRITQMTNSGILPENLLIKEGQLLSHRIVQLSLRHRLLLLPRRRDCMTNSLFFVLSGC